MSGFSNEYEVLYDMLAEHYDERLQKAERERWMRRLFANQQAETKAHRLIASIQTLCWAIAVHAVFPF